MADFDFLAARDEALTVPCPFCQANAGEPCTVSNHRGETFEMRNFPAHFPRTKAAKAAGDE